MTQYRDVYSICWPLPPAALSVGRAFRHGSWVARKEKHGKNYS
jgi:hypothetical protein